MNYRIWLLLAIVFLILGQLPALLWAGEEARPAFPKGKVSGYAFGDYFYNIEDADTLNVNKNFNAFQFRRIYFYYDYDYSEKFSVQFLLEANGKEKTSGGKIALFVKRAYLEWKDLVPRASLYMGMSATPTWSTHSEKVWAYRSIEKTIMDLRGAGVASDIGLGLKGKFDQEGMFQYHFMVGNAKGQKPEDNKYKKFYGYVIAKPLKALVLEAYGDYEGATRYSGSDRRKDIFSLKGFGAYQTENFTLGVEAFMQTKKNARIAESETLDVIPAGVTIFAHGILIKDQLKAFARYDFYNADTEINEANEHYIIAGLDYMPQKNIHIMPNILFNDYAGKDLGYDKKESEITARITFFYVYK